MATSSGVPKDNSISKEYRQFLDKLWRQVQDLVSGGSSVSLDTDGTMAANSDLVAPSQKAVRTYVTTTLSSLPCFAANKFVSGVPTDNQTGITDAVDVKVTFPTELYDLGGYYDATNSKWVPPAGVAWMSAKVIFLVTSFTDQNPIILQIYKNGASYASKSYIVNGTANNQSIDLSIQLQVNGTDYFEVYVNANTTGGGATTISGNVANTEFYGHMVAVS